MAEKVTVWLKLDPAQHERLRQFMEDTQRTQAGAAEHLVVNGLANWSRKRSREAEHSDTVDRLLTEGAVNR